MFEPEVSVLHARELYSRHGTCFDPAEAGRWGASAPSRECTESKRGLIQLLSRLYEQRGVFGEVEFAGLLALEVAYSECAKRCGRAF